MEIVRLRPEYTKEDENGFAFHPMNQESHQSYIKYYKKENS